MPHLDKLAKLQCRALRQPNLKPLKSNENVTGSESAENVQNLTAVEFTSCHMPSLLVVDLHLLCMSKEMLMHTQPHTHLHACLAFI